MRNTCFSHPWTWLFAPNDRTLRCNVIEYGNFSLRLFPVPSDSTKRSLSLYILCRLRPRIVSQSFSNIHLTAAGHGAPLTVSSFRGGSRKKLRAVRRSFSNQNNKVFNCERTLCFLKRCTTPSSFVSLLNCHRTMSTKKHRDGWGVCCDTMFHICLIKACVH